jgi:hypothetical protein
MSPTKTNTKKTSSKAASSQARTPKLIRGLPGTARERAKALRRLAEEHSETLLRLSK